MTNITETFDNAPDVLRGRLEPKYNRLCAGYAPVQRSKANSVTLNEQEEMGVGGAGG
jgi:hypothetical protein